MEVLWPMLLTRFWWSYWQAILTPPRPPPVS